ncbi:MAG: DUF4124 domain-containing protein [Nitrospinae bacterium]|nr:DUF4124 domain-containing protein [Nitrospinota bacterium]
MRGSLLGVWVLILAFACPVYAGTVKWVDDEGVTHFSDSEFAVPPQYRKKRVKLDEEKQAPLRRQAEPEAALPDAPKPMSADKYAKPDAPEQPASVASPAPPVAAPPPVQPLLAFPPQTPVKQNAGDNFDEDLKDAFTSGLSAGVLLGILLIYLGMTAGLWKMFAKADKPAWLAIIPIVNMVVLTQISGRSLFWFIMLFIPLISLVAIVLINISVAQRFGYSTGMGILAIFFPYVAYPIMGFGGNGYSRGDGLGMNI